MTKFSVRKPYTVLVAVVAIIVFGIISYSRMTPDLLPNMDYPYVVIVTTYPGATPEEVEAEITKPMEQSMATLNNIKSLTSTSSEDYSMLILEFEQDTSMDAAVVDILQQSQMLEGSWDEKVGTPNIIRINPSMMPVMVAALDSEKLDRYALCQLAEDELIPSLEGTTGLASITTGGLVERQLTVSLSNDKMDAANIKIEKAIRDSLADARKKLEDAQKEIDSASYQVKKGTEKLKNAPSEIKTPASFSTLQEDLTAAQLLATEITAAEAEREALVARREIYNRNIENAQANLDTQTAALTLIKSKRECLAPALSSADNSTPLADTGVDMAQLALLGLDCATVGEAKTLDASLAVQQTAAELNVQTAQSAFAAANAEADANLPSINTQLDDVNARLTSLTADAEKRAQSIAAAEAGLEQLPQQIMTGVGELTAASTQLAAAQASLTTAQQSLDEAFDTYDDSVDAALRAADLHKLLTLETVCAMLGAQNFDMPAGYAYEDDQSMVVTVGDGIESIADLVSVVLFDMGIDNLEPIRLREVADFRITDNADEIYATLNGNDGLLLMFFKQSNYATASVARNLRDSFAEIEEEHPEVTFTSLMDQGDYIYLIRDSILSSLLWGALFSVLVLLLFLRDWRPTLITLCSIPISLLFAMTLMYFTGVSINIMSLSGLAISVGMLVDNSIVVIENTYRLRALGENPVKAAVSGARQVGGAVAASTLTTVCVFFPIVFVSGLTRELFTDMILTLSYALIASLIVAMTLVPTLSSTLLKKEQRAYSEAGRLMTFYRKSVLWGVSHKAIVLILAVVLLFGSAGLTLLRGFTFLPEMEMEQMTVSLTMPEGATFAETVEQANEAAERMLSVRGVATVGGSVGDSAGMSITTGDEDVTYYVLLEKDSIHRATKIAEEINALCADMPCEVKADANSIMATFTELMSGSGITVRLYGNDIYALQEAGKLVTDTLLTVEGVSSAGTDEEEQTPEIHFTVDKAAAAKNNLTVAQVYMEVAKALSDSVELMDLEDNQKTYSVIVRSHEDRELTREFLEELTITVKDAQGVEIEVCLGELVTVDDRTSLATIHRSEQRRYLDVTAEVDSEHNITLVTDAAEEALAAVELPEGVKAVFTGERESIMKAMKDLLLLLLAGILLVYLVMVAQFQNLKAPFIVMFTVPLAFTGGFLAMLISGMELNMLSMLGMIMLVGIIVNNGIVLVDYINQLRMGGMERREAICDAAVTRLRPILMTTVTTVLGLIVMALGRNEATSLIQPLAVTTIGGLTYATLMTLYVIPIMYDILSKKELRRVEETDLEMSEK